MKPLEIIKIIEYWDVLRLFVAKDDDGIYYLCQVYCIENNGELKTIGVSVSPTKLKEFYKGNIDLLSMFKSPESDNAFFKIQINDIDFLAEPYDGNLDDSMLPEEGYFCTDFINLEEIL